MRETATLQGGAELERRLRELGAKVAKKIGRKALRAGAKPIQQHAKTNAPKKTGRGAKSIKVRAQKRRNKDEIGVTVTSRAGDFKGDEFYMAFQDLGWKTGSRRQESGTRRQIEGKRFMAKAFEAEKTSAVNIIGTETGRGIEAAAKE